MKTGRCSYGRSCVFNHPPRMKGQIDRDEEEVLDRPGVQKCKYFLMSGYCKYGSACRFSHPQEKRGASPPVLNFLGLPIRPGEKECSFYMRTGSCKFASNCRFHHPEPTAIGGSDARGSLSSVPLQSYVQEALQPPVPSWSQYHMPVLNISSGVVHSDSEWDSYQAPPDPSCLPEKRSSNQQNAQIDESPERPGQPECQLYMKTGVCKYKSACEYHHPKTRPSKTSGCFINPLGLPLRPDQSICAHFSHYGICKVGPSCKFDHSMNYLPGKPPSSV
ncbi:Zinc finger CCCH domain-containing protein 67 [Acorus calamus]|uniref:Zinc finger CCCH domain-containing protein 67 n=1 Tax=Acorus calamus TaxID=4465 RepID=A0AAV9CPW8_ACOCL|nr:Zinc finger CCCH domain-containing protein 67 [Acorus calamus]